MRRMDANRLSIEYGKPQSNMFIDRFCSSDFFSVFGENALRHLPFSRNRVYQDTQNVLCCISFCVNLISFLLCSIKNFVSQLFGFRSFFMHSVAPFCPSLYLKNIIQLHWNVAEKIQYSIFSYMVSARLSSRSFCLTHEKKIIVSYFGFVVKLNIPNSRHTRITNEKLQ